MVGPNVHEDVRLYLYFCICITTLSSIALIWLLLALLAFSSYMLLTPLSFGWWRELGIPLPTPLPLISDVSIMHSVTGSRVITRRCCTVVTDI